MKIAILGSGNMARAIVGAAAKSGKMPMDTFCAYDRFPEQLSKTATYGVKTSDVLYDTVKDADFVMFSVKPQDLEELISEYKSVCVDLPKKKYISICAGVSTAFICRLLDCEVPVIRVMPNAPMMIGAGATAISRNSLVSDKDYSKICGLFSFGGVVASISEDKMNAIISVNSSSPAYFYEFARIMIDYAVSQGIDEKTARTMAQNAMLGAAKMLISEQDKSPEELIAMVKSKKGTTEAALDVFADRGLKKTVFDAMDACTRRAEELGK